jgi:hypothetical protein
MFPNIAASERTPAIQIKPLVAVADLPFGFDLQGIRLMNIFSAKAKLSHPPFCLLMNHREENLLRLAVTGFV